MLKVLYTKRKGGTIRTKQLQGKLAAVLLNTQKRVLKHLERYVETWDHKPFFETKGGTRYANGDLSVGVYIDDDVFWYLELGTDVRYAVMSGDFVPKTSPGNINSQAGAGEFNYLDMRNPRPGIEPREIRKTIVTMEEFQYINDIKTVVNDIDLLEGVENILG